MDCWRLLTEPLTYTREHDSREFRVAAAAGIFSGFLIITLLSTGIVFSKIQGTLPEFVSEDVKKWNTLSFAMSGGAQVFGGILFWFVGTGMLACMSILMDGAGEYRKLLELTGYAQLPMLLFALLGFVFAVTYSPTLHIDVTATTPIEEMKIAFRKGIDAEFGQLKFRFLEAIKLGCSLWTMVLSVIALKFTNRLTWGKSVVALVSFVCFYGIIEYFKRRFLMVPV
ncbi:MAG: YIP1 family protein [Planctomycetes bacterium]|nr:YIP1 family protein [Planctomycetota bacterium]